MLSYLGREQDGTDSLDKALAHWKQVRAALNREIRSTKGERRKVLKRRLAAAEDRIGVITEHVARQAHRAAAAEAARLKREQELEEAMHWQAFDRMAAIRRRKTPGKPRRAFRWLAKRHHPDQGGSHQSFLRVKDAYDRAVAHW